MDEKNLSIIVIKSEMSSSFYETLMSVCRQLNYNDNIEVILADAVDGTAYELCRKLGRMTIHYCWIKSDLLISVHRFLKIWPR